MPCADQAVHCGCLARLPGHVLGVGLVCIGYTVGWCCASVAGCRGPCDGSQGEQLCDYCREPRAVSRVMAQWEEQVQRKSVQLTLKQQRRQQMDSDERDQQQVLEGSDAAAAKCRASSSSAQQSSVKPRPGMWGPARELSGAATVALGSPQHQQHQHLGVKPRLARQPGSSTTLSIANKAAGCLLDGTAGADCAAEEASGASGPRATAAAAVVNAGNPTTAVGVKVPPGAAAVPQLQRKRLARPPFGAFKAPRMMQDGSTNSTSSASSSKGGSNEPQQQ